MADPRTRSTNRIAAITYPYRVMIVYIVALFMTVIDGTMVNVALPRLADDFGVESTDIEWVAVGYLLALAAVIPAAGWLGDRFGTKRVFTISLVGFTSASLACGLAQSLGQLVALRVVQGLAGGLLIPVGSAMLFRAFPLAERARAAIGVLSVAVVAPALGPMIGGILVDYASWRWIFLVNIPIGAIGVVLAIAFLREEVHEEPGAFDLPGFVLAGGSVSVLLYTFSIGPERGWTSPAVLGLAAVGIAAVIGAVMVEQRVAHPMLALRLFADRLFRTVNIAASMIYAGFFGLIFILPIYLQTLRGFSAFQSGLAQSPQAVGVFVVANLLGARLYRVVGPRRLMAFGTALAALITCAYGLADLDTPLSWIAGLSFARGLAVGMVFVSIQTAVYASISNADTGRATSLFNTQRQFASASGVAVAATVLAASLGGLTDAAPAAERLAAHQHSFLAVGLIMVPAIFVSLGIHDDDVAATRGIVVDDPARSAA